MSGTIKCRPSSISDFTTFFLFLELCPLICQKEKNNSEVSDQQLPITKFSYVPVYFILQTNLSTFQSKMRQLVFFFILYVLRSGVSLWYYSAIYLGFTDSITIQSNQAAKKVTIILIMLYQLLSCGKKLKLQNKITIQMICYKKYEK